MAAQSDYEKQLQAAGWISDHRNTPVKPPQPRLISWLQRTVSQMFKRRSSSPSSERRYEQTSSRHSSGGSSWSYGYQRARGEARARTVSGFINWFFRKLPVMALLGLIVFGFFYFTNPDLRASIQERTSYQIEKFHLAETFDPIIKYLRPSTIVETAAGIGSFDTRPDYLAQEIQGVIVEDFDGEDGYVGAPLFFEGELTVDAFPEDDVTLAFDCFLKDKNKIVQEGVVTIGGEPSGTDTFILEHGQKDQKMFVTCQFDPLDDIDGVFKDYRAVLTWWYEDISTKTILRTYTQERTIQVALKKQGIDPLEGIRGTDYVDDDGYAIAGCVQHCGLVDLGLGLQSPLPLAEDGVHYLTTKLFGTTAWNGRLQHVRELTLVLPEGLSFGDQGCFFVGKKEKLLTDDHRLHLNEEHPLLNAFNQLLVQGTNNTHSDFEFKCDLDVDAGSDDQPTPETIQAVASYDYGGVETVLFKVYGAEA